MRHAGILLRIPRAHSLETRNEATPRRASQPSHRWRINGLLLTIVTWQRHVRSKARHQTLAGCCNGSNNPLMIRLSAVCDCPVMTHPVAISSMLISP